MLRMAGVLCVIILCFCSVIFCLRWRPADQTPPALSIFLLWSLVSSGCKVSKVFLFFIYFFFFPRWERREAIGLKTRTLIVNALHKSQNHSAYGVRVAAARVKNVVDT